MPNIYHTLYDCHNESLIDISIDEMCLWHDTHVVYVTTDDFFYNTIQFIFVIISKCHYSKCVIYSWVTEDALDDGDENNPVETDSILDEVFDMSLHDDYLKIS